MQVRIRKFEPETIKPDRIILIVGKRGSGKSKLLADLLYAMRDRFDFAMAMCPTMESSQMLKEVMPECCVYNRFSPAKIDMLVQTCRENAAAGKIRHVLLVLDDVFYDKSVSRSQNFRFLFFNGRHIHVTCVLLVQYICSIEPSLRTNVDYIFSMRETVLANRVKLYTMFFGCFSSFEDFAAAFDRCTQNFECIMLDNTVQSTSVSECVFWYKARLDLPPYQMGRPVFYELQTKYRRREGANIPSVEEQETVTKKPKMMVLQEGKDDDSDVR